MSSSTDEDDDVSVSDLLSNIAIASTPAAAAFGFGNKGFGGNSGGGGFGGATTSTPVSRLVSNPATASSTIGFKSQPSQSSYSQPSHQVNRAPQQQASQLFHRPTPQQQHPTPNSAPRSVSWSRDTRIPGNTGHYNPSSGSNMNKSRAMTNNFSLNKLVNVNNWPFFGQGQSFLGRTVWEWVSGRHKASFSDVIDRLNCSTIPKLLLFFVALISANM